MEPKQYLELSVQRIIKLMDNPEKEEKLNNELAHMIEMREVAEDQNSYQRPNQEQIQQGSISSDLIFRQIKDTLFKIMNERPLNGRKLDDRHELRVTAMTLLSLFFEHIVYREQPAVLKEYLQTCFHVILTDSEKIAEHAFHVLKRYIAIYEQTQHPQTLINLNEFEKEINIYTKEFFKMLKDLPKIFVDNKDSDEQVAANLLTEPLVSFEVLKQTITNLPELIPDAPVNTNAESTTPVVAEVGSSKKFQVYGSRSLVLGGEFLSNLLCQFWAVNVSTGQGRPSNQQKTKIIESFLKEFIENFDEMSKLKQEYPIFQQKGKTTIPLDYLKCVAGLLHLFKDLWLGMKDSRMASNLKIEVFFLFIIRLLRNVPNHANLLRYLVLYQFNDIVFNTIFGSQEVQQPKLEMQEKTQKALLDNVRNILDEGVLLTLKQINNPVIQESFTLVYKMYDLLKEKMDTEQLCLTIQFLLHFMLHPLTPAYQKYKIISYLNTIYFTMMHQGRQQQPTFKSSQTSQMVKVYDFQVEAFYSITKVVKYLREQTERSIEFFKENPFGDVDLPIGHCPPQQNDAEGQKLSANKTLPLDDIFVLKEHDIVQAYNNSFEVTWKNICFTQRQMQNPDVGRRQLNAQQTLKIKKEQLFKTAKQAFFNVQLILKWVSPNVGRHGNFDQKIMKLIKRFIVHSCHLIQNLTEIMPGEEKLTELSKLLQTIMTDKLQVMQYRDILNATQEDLFGLCVESTVKNSKVGIDYLSKKLMQFFPNNVNDPRIVEKKLQSDQYVAHFLEAFFEYLAQKTEVFDLKNENPDEVPRCGLSKQDLRLAKLPFKDLQETMQYLILQIGEQTLKQSNDAKVKHTFFAVFMFCIQKIRSGLIVPKYFQIVRQLLKDVCNQDDQKDPLKEVMRDFTPIVQGLLETFLQAKEEASYVKETNEICTLAPAKIRYLLDSLPAISVPLIDSMQNQSNQQIVGGIHTIQYWLSTLAPYPFLLDPIISNIQPELNQSLQGTLLQFTPISMKLIGKLGARSRQYDLDNKFNSRNYPEDGLKINLKDKYSKETVTFGIDAVIDVLFTQLSYKDTPQNQVLLQAADFIKSAFLCYIDPNLDLNFIIATIVATKNNLESPSATMFAQHGIKIPGFVFNAREKQIFVSQMSRGCESHAFVKLLRCAIMGYKALSTTPEELKKQQRKQNNFMKWITQYFTLIYICKNGNLQTTMVDEINPLVLVDMIVELLYHYIDNNSLSSKSKDLPLIKGSAVALKTMIRFLKKLYGNAPEIFNQLEIISILIKRICNQVQELPKNLAINIAIRILVTELPDYAVRQHADILLNTLFLILNQSSDSVVKSIEERVKPTLNQLFESLGIYEFSQKVRQNSFTFHYFIDDILNAQSDSKLVNDEIKFFKETLDKILLNVLCVQESTQKVAIHFIQEVAKHNDVKVCDLLRNLPKQNLQKLGKPIDMKWSQYLFEQEIQQKVKEIFEMYKGGYGQIQQLISYLNVVQFYLHHEEKANILDKLHVFLGIADCILLILEDECNKMEAVLEPQNKPYQASSQSVSITRIARRYIKLEKSYQAYNKEYDPYSHTMHPHQILNSHFFEVSQQAKEDHQKDEIEEMRKQQSYLEMNIFEARRVNERNEEVFASGLVRQPDMPDGGNRHQTNSYEKNAEAMRVFPTLREQEKFRGHVNKRIDHFIATMFGSAQQTANQPQKQNLQKVHDVSNSYMRNLYEMYPNVRLHCEMLCKCMKLLCDIASHNDLAKTFADRQDEFFNQPAPGQEQRQDDQFMNQPIDINQSCLKTSLDYYIVEIKAKIICIFFKYFQRDERNVQKMAKKCMKRLLKIQETPYEAFPNRILRECVRPILNSINTKQQIQQFWHLGRLIKVLYNYFNQGLGSAVMKNLQSLQQQIREPYKITVLLDRRSQPPVLGPDEQPLSNQPQDGNGQPLPSAEGQNPTPGLARPFDKEQINQEIINLVEQHNIKVQQISTAVGIINSLHLLLLIYQRNDGINQKSLDELNRTIKDSLEFQKFLVEEFKARFEQKFDQILMELPQGQPNAQIEMKQKYFDQLNPLINKVGYLKSEILEGVEKYFNVMVLIQPYQVLQIQDSNTDKMLVDVILEILNRQENFCIREKISLDKVISTYFRHRGQNREISPNFLMLINQVYIYSKFYPQCLKYQNNTTILDILREKWLNKEVPPAFTYSQSRDTYMRIQKCLVIYCQTEGSDVQILFDLLKDFFCNIPIDLKPLVTLCTIEIPNKASDERKIQILQTALTKIQTSTCSYESKYYMFEFAFMPIALQCANNKKQFDTIFNQKLIGKFIETFFSKERRGGTEMTWIWYFIYQTMEKRHKVSYQNFFTEIVKVLIIIMRHIDTWHHFEQLNCEPQNIIQFLDWIIKNATDQHLKEYAFFALSCFGLRMLDLPVDQPDAPENKESEDANMEQHPTQDSRITDKFLNILCKDVLAPLFELNLEQQYDKTFLQVGMRLQHTTESKNAKDLMQVAERLHRIHFEVHNKTLVQNTFINMLRIFEDPRIATQGNQNSLIVQQLQNFPQQKNEIDIWQYFKRQFSLRPGLPSRMSLCNLISNSAIVKEKVINDSLQRRIAKTIKLFFLNNNFTQDASLRLNQCREVLSLITTLITWTYHLNSCVDMEQLKMYFTMVTHNLFRQQLISFADPFIMQMRDQAAGIQQAMKNEFYEFMIHCFQLVKRICSLLSDQVCFMYEKKDSIEFFNDGEKVKLALKTAFNFNIQSLSIQQGFSTESTRRMLSDFLQNTYVPTEEMLKIDQQYFMLPKTRFIPMDCKQVNSVLKMQQQQARMPGEEHLNLDPKNLPRIKRPLNDFGESAYQIQMILHPIHVIMMSVRKSKESSNIAAEDSLKVNELQPFLRQAMWYDVRRCLDKDLKILQTQLVKEFQMTQQKTINQNLHQSNLGIQQNIVQATIMKTIADSTLNEQNLVQACFPHFTIRIIHKFEELKDEGIITEEELAQWIDPDLFKEISATIQKVVSAFKQVICSDKSVQKIIQQQSDDEKSATEEKEPEKDKKKYNTYDDIDFKDDLVEFHLKDIDFDLWMKETIMIAIKSIVRRIKNSMNQEDTLVALEQLKLIFKSFYFQQMKTCEFLLEQFYDVMKYIIEDQSHQRIKLVVNEKTALLYRLLQLTKPKDMSNGKTDPNSILNRICTLCLDFLEGQPNIMQSEQLLRFYEKIFYLNQFCSFELGQRQFKIFEKFFGASLKAKINFFFNKLTLENLESFRDNSQLKYLLEFTLYNFDEDIPLHTIKNSTNLCPLSNRQVVIEGLDAINQTIEGNEIKETLGPFMKRYNKYKGRKLSALMRPLTEIIRLNPEHNYQDKNIAEKIFSKVFWQYWQILDRTDQQYLSESFNKIFQNFIKFTSWLTPHMKQQFGRTLLEQVVLLKDPQVRIEPEILQYLGKHFNLWHVSIPQLEDHVQLYKNNERYIHALQELYSGLYEEDLQFGLSRMVTKSDEMRSMYTMAQHHCWEQFNSLFGQYINFYAEQEGLLKHLENAQNMPGKYSRQLAKNSLIDMINQNDPQPRQINTRVNNDQYDKLFEKNPEVAEKLKNRHFPKSGGNRKISDIDLRSWETLYMKSLRILRQSDLFKDVAENMQRPELIIENYWIKKDMKRLYQVLSKVLAPTNANIHYTIPFSSIQKVRYHMYFGYVLASQIEQDGFNLLNENQLQLQQELKQKFGDNYSETVNLAVKQLTEHLPSYTDAIQNEYYILFQQILESQEGMGNMIMEHERKNLPDLRNMMNIWRERLPNKSETIQTWQELLENRNYIFSKLQQKIQKQNARAAMATTGVDPTDAAKQAAAAVQIQQTPAEKFKLIDQIDLIWNYLKLAEISRKHNLPNLAQEYLENCKPFLVNEEARGDILKLERFKYYYETFKLTMKFHKDPTTQHECLIKSLEFVDKNEYDLWMHAEILRLMGQHYLDTGKIRLAFDKLNYSIEKNRREAKTWLVYAKLNETVYQTQKEERSVQMALKGYFNAMTLSQHKARLIIPNVLKLLKQKSYQDQLNKPREQPKVTPQQQQQQKKNDLAIFVSMNVTQMMPIWLWIFWIPQIIQFLALPKDDLLHAISSYICLKICKLYPQVAWYPLKAKTATVQRPPQQNQPNVRPDAQAARNTWDQMFQKVQIALNKRNQKLSRNLMQMMVELKNISVQNKDEKLIGILQNSLNFSTQLHHRKTIEHEWKLRIDQIYKVILLDASTPSSQEVVKREWDKQLFNQETREASLLEQIKIVKNIKDYLLIQGNMREQDIYLQEISPYLASFSQRGIELPGQHVLNEGEPRPEKVIMIDKMGHEIKRMGQKEKKIKFMCTNNKSYHFSLGVSTNKEYKMFLSQERVTQLKVVSNMLLKKNKESARRGIKYYAAPQVLFPGCKLVQDDLSFGDLQETHDYLLQERGLDPDMALLLEIQHCQDLFEQLPEDQRKIDSITELQIQQMNQACYKQMRHEVKPSLLSSYFHRIFSNVDNMFIFKKQFTKYHAINSFFSYAFNQANFQDLNALSFCKATGRINFSQANLRHALSTSRDVLTQYTFEEIEADIFRITPCTLIPTPVKQPSETDKQQPNQNPSAQMPKNEYFVPFRITPNIEEFIGKIGIQGLFAGVITSASLAVCSQKQKNQVLLELLLSEENQQMRESVPNQPLRQQRAEPQPLPHDDEASKFAEFCLFKIASLSEHEMIIQQPQKSEESKCQPLKPEEECKGIGYNRQTGHYILGNHKVPRSFLDLEMDRPNITEEFNRKVFSLIEMATDDARRSQRSINWCPWF